MKNQDKYLEPLKKVASAHFDIVQDEMVSFHLGKLMATGFKGKCKISTSQWKSLGSPPAEKYENGYLLDLSDSRIVGVLWMKSSYDAMNMGCYAATDISDSINLINNDNLDHILTDREAMVAVSQVMISGMEGFKKMKSRVDSEMNGPV